jgi:hypothetical protein
MSRNTSVGRAEGIATELGRCVHRIAGTAKRTANVSNEADTATSSMNHAEMPRTKHAPTPGAETTEAPRAIGAVELLGANLRRSTTIG